MKRTVIFMVVVLCVVAGIWQLMLKRTSPPIRYSWKLYSDIVHDDFSFEYPDFLSPVEIQSQEAVNSPTVRLNKQGVLEIFITGPLRQSETIQKQQWTSFQSLPNVGVFHERTGITTNAMITMGEAPALLTTFIHFGRHSPNLWRAYFYTSYGIYYIDVTIPVGSPLSNEQHIDILSRILNSFRYTQGN